MLSSPTTDGLACMDHVCRATRVFDQGGIRGQASTLFKTMISSASDLQPRRTHIVRIQSFLSAPHFWLRMGLSSRARILRTHPTVYCMPWAIVVYIFNLTGGTICAERTAIVKAVVRCHFVVCFTAHVSRARAPNPLLRWQSSRRSIERLFSLSHPFRLIVTVM